MISSPSFVGFAAMLYFRFSAVPDEPARITAVQITGNPDPVKILPRVPSVHPQFRIRDPPE